MKIIRIVTLAMTAMTGMIALTAQAMPISMGTVYQLGNHPDGGARPPLYGLRLDGLLTGNTNDIYTFDFDDAASDMRMVWNDLGQLRIYGTAAGGQDAGSSGDYVAGTTALWSIDFLYDEALVNCGSGLCVAASDQGTGTLVSSFGSFDMGSVSGSNSYDFKLDTGHRGYAGVSGWGWVNHCATENNDADATNDVNYGASCGQHLYASDWLFAVTNEVPEPGTLWLLGAGLLGIGLSRRRRKST